LKYLEAQARVAIVNRLPSTTRRDPAFDMAGFVELDNEDFNLKRVGIYSNP